MYKSVPVSYLLCAFCALCAICRSGACQSIATFMGSDIVLSKLDAAPSPGQIARPIIYDGSTSDAPSQATHHNHSDTLIGLSIPLAQQRFFASFASQNERTDALTNVAVRQFSLSFKYPLSHALNLFIAKTRADNINSAGYATQSAVVPKSVQLGIRYDF